MAELQSALEEAFAKAEDGTLEAPVERSIEVNDDPIRNEKGQFVSRKEETQETVQPAEAQAQNEEQAVEPQEYSPSVARPTTWKKEYLPLWDKLDKGEALSQDEAR